MMVVMDYRDFKRLNEIVDVVAFWLIVSFMGGILIAAFVLAFLGL